MLKMRVPMSISLLFVWLLLSFANCSHFRGGSLSWKPAPNPSQIEISHQMAWRRSYSSSSFCNDGTIANGGIVSISANLYCREGCNSTGRISSMTGRCIAFSAEEDWSLGEGSFLFTVPTLGIQYTFRFEGCCWQSLRNGGSSSSMRMTLTADLQPRSDTGVINSSPVATMTPVVRLLAGCQHSLRIPVIDADGDIVRCRFPTSNNTNECGYLCDGLSGSTIDTDTCIFNYNTTSGTGTYGVGLQIEDFAVSAPSIVLSSVPVQFLIIVFSDSLSCDDRPSFVDPTPPEASCHVVTSTFTKTLVARTKNAAHSITKIFLMGPTGITKTNLAPYGSSGREWSITVTWSPTQNQGGYHLMCFSAEINSKLSSSMICIDLMKGTPPPIRQNCLTPSSEVVMGPNITFRMCFDRKIMRPTTDKFMKIYYSNGTESNRLNITDPSLVTFSTSSDRTVTVTWGGSSGPDILGVGQYYILLEAGSVAAPPLSCLSDWPGITQPFYWNFTVVDRTPPSLSFTSNPTQVNVNEPFSMTWIVSESLSVERCNLTTPSSSSIVNCRGSFNQNILVAGNYSIIIEIEDLYGNKAEPFDHQWIVIDHTPPSLSFTSNPTQVNDNETFSMTWTVSESLSMERCNLTTPSSSSIVNCRGSFDRNNLVAGNYSISIEIEDLNGNKAGPFGHQWIVYDVTPPVLTFVTNPSLTKSNASIIWTVSEPVASSKCTVTFPNGTLVNETCNDQWEAIDLPRGTYQISIVLVDAAGNIGGAFRHTWTNIDVTPPILTFRRKPRRSLSKANITWVTNEEADGVCEVQGPSSFYRSVVCDKAWSEDYLPEGDFILNVTVYDRSLNMAGPFQHTWYNRDVKPPELKLTSTPYCDKSYDNASLTWTYNEYATSSCLIKTSLKTEFVICDKSWSGTFLPEGNVTIEITSRDQSRNSAPSYKYTWYNKDITPPVLTFTRNGALTINDATITWSVNEPVSVNCTLTTPFTTLVFSGDSGSWSGNSLQGGIYELSISLLDLGNNSAGPYVHKWRNVDTIRPRMNFTKTPSRTYSNATIQWDVSEPVNGSCEIRGPSNFYRNVSCDRSWVGLNLPPGSFTLITMVTDTSGNIGGPSSHTWINEDVTPPSLQWVGSTPSQTNGSIILSWTTDEAVTSLCTVHTPVKATDVSCNNKWVGTELRHGEYSLTVKMVDGSGNKAQAVHRWNNTAQELVFEVILTLSNVEVMNFTNKTSPEYSKLETESQTGLENFYQQNVDNFKAVNIRHINVVSERTRQKRSTTSTGSQIVVDHDVVLGGNNMSTGSASLSKTLSTLSTGGSAITIGGSTATFANVTLLLDKRASNVTFSRDSGTCEMAQLYVKCGLREYCDESTGMCVTNAKPDNNGMILSIGLGVSGLVVLLLTTIIVVLFYIRRKAEQQKQRQQIESDAKKRFEKPVETITFPPQIMYKPYKYWQ